MKNRIETTTLRCSCGQKYSCTAASIAGEMFFPYVCPVCEHYSARDIEDRWAKICPVEFRTEGEGGNTILSQLRVGHPSLEIALHWKLNDKGLFMFGETGTKKTRSMWRVMRYLSDLRIPIKALSGGEFERQCRDAMHSGGMTDWFDKLAGVPVLFIDDIFKMTLTDFVQTSLFDLIDDRGKNGRPLFATTNDTASSLETRIPGDKVNPMLRRIADYCTILSFSESKS